MIEIEGVTKIFRVEGNTKTVLDNVSLTLPPDKSVALIGRNGAGKSSLLKIISGLSKPSEGFVRTSCRISWPIGFAGSFHKELSGAQNARFVARVYGVPSDQVVDYVARFSELGNELYNPVRTYSSGMRARLAFAVSMAVDFDYYLIDEVTSVGDTSFRKKCADTLLQKIGKCGALVVSHNTGTLKKLCTSAVVIENSQAYYFDAVAPAITFYKWCQDSYFNPDEVGDMTGVLKNIDELDPESKIYEMNREHRPHRNPVRRLIESIGPSVANAQSQHGDTIEDSLKNYAPSGSIRGQDAEVLSELAMDKKTWPRIFPATSPEVSLRTLDKFVENERWKEAKSLSFFLFTERIDGAAAVLESLTRTFMKFREEEEPKKKERKGKKDKKSKKADQDPGNQKNDKEGQPSRNVSGFWLTLARAAARAHDAGPAAHLLAAEALLSAPRPFLDEAQLHVEQVLAQEPYSATAHYTLARVHFHRRQFDEAKLALERALEIDPHQAEALDLREQIEQKTATLAGNEDALHPMVDDEVVDLDDELDDDDLLDDDDDDDDDDLLEKRVEMLISRRDRIKARKLDKK